MMTESPLSQIRRRAVRPKASEDQTANTSSNMMEEMNDVNFSGRPDAEQPQNGNSTGQQHAGDDDDENPHDQMPTVEEYKTQVAADANPSVDQSEQFIRCAVYGIAVILISVCLIVMGVIIGRNNNNESSSDNNSVVVPTYGDTTGGGEGDSPAANPEPTPAPKSQVFEVARFIADQGWSDVFDVTSPDKPQWKAAEWLADIDPAKLTPSTDIKYKERYALVVIYYAMNGDDWKHGVNEPWLVELDHCKWNKEFVDQRSQTYIIGATCEGSNEVKAIDLSGLQTPGTLPPEIGLFANLERINLRDNFIKYEDTTESLPPQLGSLNYLISLNLENNDFYGNIPAWIDKMSALGELNLKDNLFEGAIPSTIRNLKNLHTLNLENNLLTGDLKQLEDLSQLQAIFLGNNNITGPLDPEAFRTWNNIGALDLSNNALTGALPSQLFAVSKLMILDLHGNYFQGDLPDLVSIDTSIVYLALHDNDFTGGLNGLRYLEQLEHLDLSFNKFLGTMPTEYGGLAKLQYLFMAFNNFTKGELPTEYGRLTNLVDLSLQKTQRASRIPTEYGQLTKLRLLDLNQNQLHGRVPTEIGNLVELQFLTLKSNDLGGALPTTFSNLINLKMAVINDNLFAGSAQGFCALPNLTQAIADCDEVQCSCCTCCDENNTCNDVVWFAGVDPVFSPDHQFDRVYYSFDEARVAYPVDAATAPKANEWFKDGGADAADLEQQIAAGLGALNKTNSSTTGGDTLLWGGGNASDTEAGGGDNEGGDN